MWQSILSFSYSIIRHVNFAIRIHWTFFPRVDVCDIWFRSTLDYVSRISQHGPCAIYKKVTPINNVFTQTLFDTSHFEDITFIDPIIYTMGIMVNGWWHVDSNNEEIPFAGVWNTSLWLAAYPGWKDWAEKTLVKWIGRLAFCFLHRTLYQETTGAFNT